MLFPINKCNALEHYPLEMSQMGGENKNNFNQHCLVEHIGTVKY